MFNDSPSGQGWPEHISSDNDPMFQYHRWKANLRVIEIEEIKSLPIVPMSLPFGERLIGGIRRELPDQALFWTATDLENKLGAYQDYYNDHLCHSSREGATPAESECSASLISAATDEKNIAAACNSYQWQLEVGIRHGQATRLCRWARIFREKRNRI